MTVRPSPLCLAGLVGGDREGAEGAKARDICGIFAEHCGLVCGHGPCAAGGSRPSVNHSCAVLLITAIYRSCRTCSMTLRQGCRCSRAQNACCPRMCTSSECHRGHTYPRMHAILEHRSVLTVAFANVSHLLLAGAAPAATLPSGSPASTLNAGVSTTCSVGHCAQQRSAYASASCPLLQHPTCRCATAAFPLQGHAVRCSGRSQWHVCKQTDCVSAHRPGQRADTAMRHTGFIPTMFPWRLCCRARIRMMHI